MLKKSNSTNSFILKYGTICNPDNKIITKPNVNNRNLK